MVPFYSEIIYKKKPKFQDISNLYSKSQSLSLCIDLYIFIIASTEE